MIHKYIFKDNFIVMDINSGAVHIVDKVIYEVLSVFEKYSAGYSGELLYKECKDEVPAAFDGIFSGQEIQEALSDIYELINQKMLFTDNELPGNVFDTKEPVIKAMCLHAAHDCNMKCTYCFGDKGAFEGERCLLSVETGKKAIDFLIANSGSRRNLEVDFFGGEPTMNFEAIKEVVAYARSVEKENNKNIRFTITTNGLLLDDEKIDYINEVMDNVVLSIDGRPEVNDRMRKTVNGKGTYDLIMDNYRNFIKKRDGLYYVRGTFTAYNIDFSEDVRHLSEQGFETISVEPVVTPAENEYALRDKDRETILAEYDKLADLYIEKYEEGHPFNFFHFNVDLNQGPCIVKRVSGCGAGTEYIAISPEGDIYPCHQFVGNKDFLLGTLDDEYNNRLYDFFNQANVTRKPACITCWAKYYCSGGCHANAYHTNSDIMKPYELGCDMEKKRIECAIGIQAYLSE